MQPLILPISWKVKIMKVYIIGAGPAGCSLAHLLADKGYKVEIYEQKKNLSWQSL